MGSAWSGERRKSCRIKVQRGVVAVSQDDLLSIGGLIDINLEGLSLVQSGKGTLKDESIELDILALHDEEGKDLFLSGINARLVSAVVVSTDDAGNTIEHKRYGLHFNELSSQQRDDLKRFIYLQSTS